MFQPLLELPTWPKNSHALIPVSLVWLTLTLTFHFNFYASMFSRLVAVMLYCTVCPVMSVLHFHTAWIAGFHTGSRGTLGNPQNICNNELMVLQSLLCQLPYNMYYLRGGLIFVVFVVDRHLYKLYLRLLLCLELSIKKISVPSTHGIGKHIHEIFCSTAWPPFRLWLLPQCSDPLGCLSLSYTPVLLWQLPPILLCRRGLGPSFTITKG